MNAGSSIEGFEIAIDIARISRTSIVLSQSECASVLYFTDIRTAIEIPKHVPSVQ